MAGEIFVYSNFHVLPPIRAGPWAGLTFMLGEYSRRCGREIFSKIYLYFFGGTPAVSGGTFWGLGGNLGGSSREVPPTQQRSMNTPNLGFDPRTVFQRPPAPSLILPRALQLAPQGLLLLPPVPGALPARGMRFRRSEPHQGAVPRKSRA